jgi:hypothetical protein
MTVRCCLFFRAESAAAAGRAVSCSLTARRPTATVCGVEGLVLVEAKAHSNELKRDGHGARHSENAKKIRAAIDSANGALNEAGGRWNLTCDSHYQLANRFAWCWKLASLGVPVVLVYLGFLNASEMDGQGDPFSSADSWEQAVRAHARELVPEDVWGHPLHVESTPLIPLIRSLEIPLPYPRARADTEVKIDGAW